MRGIVGTAFFAHRPILPAFFPTPSSNNNNTEGPHTRHHTPMEDASPPHPHQRPPHVHRPSDPRPEADLTATGVTWDERRHEWVSDEEANGEEGSRRTTVVGGGGDEGKGSEGDKSGDGEVIWLEWAEGDRDNPFNVSFFLLLPLPWWEGARMGAGADGFTPLRDPTYPRR